MADLQVWTACGNDAMNVERVQVVKSSARLLPHAPPCSIWADLGWQVTGYATVYGLAEHCAGMMNDCNEMHKCQTSEDNEREEARNRYRSRENGAMDGLSESA